MQDVRRSALQEPRYQVAAGVHASRPNRAFAAHSADARRSLVDGLISGSGRHCVSNSAA